MLKGARRVTQAYRVSTRSGNGRWVVPEANPNMQGGSFTPEAEKPLTGSTR